MKRAVALVSAILGACTSPAAHGGDPFEIQVYDGTANAPGVLGVELHLNDWATGNRAATPPEAALHGQAHATLEPSFGVMPFWEVGAYLQSAVRTDDGVVDWAGAKLRSKFVTPPSWNAHVRLGANLELSYLPSTYDRARWGMELRPIAAWHDDDWLLVVNPILDQPFAGSDAKDGPSFEPAVKLARTVGPVALGIEYYATLGPLSALRPWRDEQQQIFEVIDFLRLGDIELNVGAGEGLTAASEGLVFKAIVGYAFDATRPAGIREGEYSPMSHSGLTAK
ncbi:MAG TPA: hypothetical protein VKU41_07080 [Polyangiaceae bacterium]|nr:hypothetical protein [Polyangiaceae bacterium]